MLNNTDWSVIEERDIKGMQVAEPQTCHIVLGVGDIGDLASVWLLNPLTLPVRVWSVATHKILHIIHCWLYGIFEQTNHGVEIKTEAT